MASKWGQRFSYVRTGDEAHQPFDILDLNEQPNRPANSPDQALFFASVESGDSWCFFEWMSSGYRIGKTDRQEFLPDHYWTSFWAWLSDEVNKVASNGIDNDISVQIDSLTELRVHLSHASRSSRRNRSASSGEAEAPLPDPISAT